MNARIILRLARIFISLATTFTVLPASAESMWTQLDFHNLENQRLAFTIKTENTADSVRFLVTIESKKAALSPFLQANVTVVDGKKQIDSPAVEKARQKKGVIYEFVVFSNNLAESKFTFGNMAEAGGKPMPAGDFYWFYLTDFVATRQSFNIDDIKITFANPPTVPTANTHFRDTAEPYDPGPNEHGALANFATSQIAVLTVTWADPERFKTESQTKEFLTDLLTSTNEGNWPYHLWSYSDGVPSLVATVKHTTGKQGIWVVWCSPTIDWLYEDKNGIKWWGMWNWDAPKPKGSPLHQ